jgi:hypothetical protein
MKKQLYVNKARVLICIMALLLHACAQIVAPSGGPKDVISPKIKSSAPENYALNYTDNKIHLAFDEYIQVKNWNQVLISPPLKNSPEYSLKGKKLEIELKDTLSKNTTYTINFGTTIVDNNEGNVLDSNVLIFSTGAFLDSLKFEGSVVNSFNKKPEKNILVMLFPFTYEAIKQDSLPAYYTKTDEAGHFLIKHVKNGTYKILALKDNNQNFRYDQPSEAVAFIDYDVDSSINSKIKMNIFEEEAEKVFIKKTTTESPGRINIFLNKGVKNFSFDFIKPHINKEDIIVETNNKDSIILWLKNNLSDTILLTVGDSKKFQDTLLLSFAKKEKSTLNSEKNKTISTQSNLSKDGVLHYQTNLLLDFNCPIKELDVKKFILINSSDTLNFQSKFIDSANRKLEITYPFKPDSSYQLIIADSSLQDIFGNFNKKLVLNFKTQNPEHYSAISIKIKGLKEEQNRIIQLLDEKQQVIKQKMIDKNENIRFEYTEPGNYFLKLILDSDNNGEWTTGNYKLKKQPELVYLYNKALQIKSNWDMELEWEIIE